MNIRVRAVFLTIPALVVLFSGCTDGAGVLNKNHIISYAKYSQGYSGTAGVLDRNYITHYSQIPGVTAEETEKIEFVKTKYRSFSYGSRVSSESFIRLNGSYGGFSALLCNLLSGLFDIPFIPEIYNYSAILSGVDGKKLDFTGEMPYTARNRQQYFMTYTIAERKLMIFTWGDSEKIKTEDDVNGLKLGFPDGSTIQESISEIYTHLAFESVYFQTSMEAVNMLASGAIDAIVDYAVVSSAYDSYDSIFSRDFFNLVYSPVSLATANPELAPFISVINKYIESGGIDRLYDLYRQGYNEYTRNELQKKLSFEEILYLENLIANNLEIPVALESDNYPICFWDKKSKKTRGIAKDILDEVSDLFGITFRQSVDENTPWHVIMEKLRTGEVALVSELMRTEEREGRFLWSDPVSTSQYVLFSRSDYPDLEIYQVVKATVGIKEGTAFHDVYNRWFPNNSNVVYYDLMPDALKALDNGDIDLIMTSDNMLLMVLNYMELPGYKINIRFQSPSVVSYFGFNANEEILRSIINKTLKYIDLEKIENNWKSYINDYSRMVAEERNKYLAIFLTIMVALLLILIGELVKNSRISADLKKQVTTLSTIYDSLPDMLFIKDIEGRYTSCNHSFELFVGMTEAELLGKKAKEIHMQDPHRLKIVEYHDQKVLEKNSPVKMEDWETFSDMSRRYIETIKVPLIQDGKTTGLLGISRDITEHKAAEKAANDASRAKSDFLAKMSHEIRTPMNAIIGMAELAIRSEDLDDAREYAVTAKQAGANLLALINDILDFSKIETGKLEIIENDYQFSSLVNDVVSIIRMKVLDSRIRFTVNIDSKIPNALIGDEIRIRQILLNLLTNAVKYTDAGFVSFNAYGEQVDGDIVNLTLEVADSGRGIKEENLNKLFREYAQFDMEKNRGIEGAGLGLAITWNMVKAMGGDINVSSEYGKGSIFTATLPQRIRSPEPLAVVHRPETKDVIVYERRETYSSSIMFSVKNLGVNGVLVTTDEEFYRAISEKEYPYIFISSALLAVNRDIINRLCSNSKIVVPVEFGEVVPDKNLSTIAMPVYSMTIAAILNGDSDRYSYSENSALIERFTAPEARVLIVDDIITNLKVAQGLLLPYKMQVDLCKSGRMAIEAIKANKYDLIFMDHKMPEMDGIEATAIIRALGKEEPYYRDLPIIVLTANAISGTRELFLENGFNDYVSKPIDTVKLSVVLERWLPKEKQKKTD